MCKAALLLDGGECGELFVELLLQLKGTDDGYAVVVSSDANGDPGSRRIYWLDATVDDPGILGDKPKLMDRQASLAVISGFDRLLQFQCGTQFTLQAGIVVELLQAQGVIFSATELSLEGYRLYVGGDRLPVCLVSEDKPDLTSMQRLRLAEEVLMRNRPGHQPYPRLLHIDPFPLVDDLAAAVRADLTARAASRSASG